jgi:hypothetical protein
MEIIRIMRIMGIMEIMEILEIMKILLIFYKLNNKFAQGADLGQIYSKNKVY